MRINAYVAAASGMARRAADGAVAAGRVTVNGQPARIGQTVATGDRVELDGRLLEPASTHTYVMLNKPAGYVTSRIRQGMDPTVYELLPEALQGLRPVGRLDRDSSGLLLLSDDGAFIHRLTHPSFGKEKVYELTLDRTVTAEDRRRLEQGVELADGPSRLRMVHAAGTQLTAALSEGRNRQLRRTLGVLGYSVERLHRTQAGPYRLDELAEGAWRPVAPALVAATAEEVAA